MKKYVVDNDMHLHSNYSLCAQDPLQTKDNILLYAKKNGYKTICVTDHFWDEELDGAFSSYPITNYKHISQINPLPQEDDIRFLFGCEVEMDANYRISITKEKFDLFDFIVIPTTHFHFKEYVLSKEDLVDNKSRAMAWVKRFDAVLNMDLPFEKVGIAHLTCSCIAPTEEGVIEVLSLIPEDEMYRLFKKAAEKGVGIELNAHSLLFDDNSAEIYLRPYKIAKECGCRFYCGTDAHTMAGFEGTKLVLQKVAERLNLTEEDKFIL